MQTIIICLIFTFTSIFSIRTFAQEKTKNVNPDEVLHSLKEKLAKLKLLVSTQKDVKKVFGEDCRFGCQVKKGDWLVYIDYVGERVATEDSTRQTIIGKLRSKEYFGKLLNVSVVGYRNSLTDSFISSENLKCFKTVTFGAASDNPHTRICSDNQGLVYFVYDDFLRDGQSFKNMLATIHYSLSDEKFNELFVLEKAIQIILKVISLQSVKLD